jgi:hypothetical protein
MITRIKDLLNIHVDWDDSTGSHLLFGLQRQAALEPLQPSASLLGQLH